MTTPPPAAARPTSLAPLLGAACLLLHLVANPHYGVFRDELYFIACGLRPALGYADQPPLVPLIAAASFKLFGTALTPLRLAPALAMSATVALTAAFARELGGGRFAQALAGLAVLFAPVMLVDGVLLFTDMLQPLTWLASAMLLTRLARRDNPRLWLALGAVIGVSLWSKYLVAFWAVGLAAGVVATPLRRRLKTPWPWAGAGLALLVISPNLAWQAAHGFPFLEVAASGAEGKNIALAPFGFFAAQILFVGPLAAPVWTAGLWRLARGHEGPEGRALAVAYLAAAALFILGHGKAYYLAPAYPALFAAGGAFWERWLKTRAVRAATLGVVTLAKLGAAPFAVPILPPETFIAYSRLLGISSSQLATERIRQADLPQHFADMFGWPEMAAEVARVYRALPEDERARAVFFGRNYGEAAAVEIYGGAPAISGHNQYWLWGPRGFDGSVVIALGKEPSGFAKYFGAAVVAGRIENAYALPYETSLNVYVLRRPKRSLAEIWPELKHFN